MITTFIFPKNAIGVMINPRESWQVLATQLQLSKILAWQLIIGLVGLVVITWRVKVLVDSNPQFTGSGINVLFVILLLAKLIAYYLYILFGAWVVYVATRSSCSACSYKMALAAFSYASLPLLAGWLLQSILALFKNPSNLAGITDFRLFVETIWAAISIRADLSALLPLTNGIVNAILRVLSVFWIWHFFGLCIGLHSSFRLSRRVLAGVIAIIFFIVVLSQYFILSASGNWQILVNWKE